MRRTCFSSAAVLALGLLLAGCGKSKQHEILDQLQAECEALVTSHASFRDALIDFRAADLVEPPNGVPACSKNLFSLPSNDTCAPASDATPVCEVAFEYLSNDPGLCSAGRCWYVCDVRMMQADYLAALNAQDLTLAPVCASRWVPNAF
jgi:hypothetical protein